jgi:hypothetical protein
MERASAQINILNFNTFIEAKKLPAMFLAEQRPRSFRSILLTSPADKTGNEFNSNELATAKIQI